MFDRHLIGDIGLAILLAAPTLALSRPQPPAAEERTAVAPLAEQAAIVHQSSTERRFSLDG